MLSQVILVESAEIDSLRKALVTPERSMLEGWNLYKLKEKDFFYRVIMAKP